MCNYQTWFHDEKSGYIVECNKCNKLQLSFVNIMITLKKQEFENFRNYLHSTMEGRVAYNNGDVKSVVLSTPCEGINFLLSETELQGLYKMIDYVDTEMKTAILLKMFAA